MNNEPVAWMSEFGQFIGKVQDEICHIPLYTHPLNQKYDPETGEPLIDGYPLFSGLPHPVKELTDAIETLENLLDIADNGIREGYKTMNSHFVIEEIKQAILEIKEAQEK